MSTKTLTILAGVLILLIAVIGLQFWGPAVLPQKESPYKTAVKAANAETINAITITKQGQSVTLKRENGTWKIEGKPAGKDKIDQLFTQFINNPIAQEIAQTNARHKEFEVTDDTATTVQFSDTLTLLAGKSAGEGIYVRIKGSDAVYILTNASTSTVSTVPADWQDKTIVKIEESALKKISIVKGAERFSLLKENGTWMVEEGKKEIESSAITPLLGEIASFQATSLADEKTAAPFLKSSALAQITLEHGNTTDVLEFVQGDNAKYLVTRQSDKLQFIVDEFKAKHFLINQQDIIKKNPSDAPKPS